MKKIVLGLLAFTMLSEITFSQDPAINHWEMIFDYTQPAKYKMATGIPDADWNLPDYNDDSWDEFINLMGYGGIIDEIVYCCGFPDLGLSQTSTFYTRTEFTVGDTSLIENLMLSIGYEDAFVAYINGMEVARANMGDPGSLTSYDQYADSTYHFEADLFIGQFTPGYVIDKAILKQCLVEGTNVLAIEIHNDTYEPSSHNYIAFLFAGLRDASTPFYAMDTYFPIGMQVDSSNLPIVVIDLPAGGMIPDEPKITAQMKIYDRADQSYNRISDSASYEGYIGIELRGSSSMYNYPKKSFTLETRDEAGENDNVSILGMPTENDWVLYAPYGDKTLIRNVITYKWSQDMGHYAPRTRCVELVRNGLGYGMYVFTEKIKRDNDRIDIAGLRPDEIAGDSLSGGYIIKIDKTEGNYGGWSSEYGTAEDHGRTYFQYVYPKYDEIVEEQKQYIKDFMRNFESVLRSDQFDDPVVGYPGIIDTKSFIDYLIINELSKNIDGYRLSTFMYKDRDDNDPKLYIGPLWDFNLAYGNASYCDGPLTTGWSFDFSRVCPSDSYLVPFWWDRFFQDENFSQQLRARYEQLRTTHLHIDSIYADIDSLVTLTSEARIRNYTIWQDLFTSYIWPNNPLASDYEGEILYLKNWIADRISWLDQNMGETRERRYYVAIESPEITEYVSVGAYPNPFNEELTFSFELSRPHTLRLDIYTMNGQIVRTLENREYPEGYHEVSWDGTNQSGQYLVSGMYIYTLTLDNSVQHHGKLVKR